MKTEEDIHKEIKRSQALYNTEHTNGKLSLIHGRIMALQWVLNK